MRLHRFVLFSGATLLLLVTALTMLTPLSIYVFLPTQSPPLFLPYRHRGFVSFASSSSSPPSSPPLVVLITGLLNRFTYAAGTASYDGCHVVIVLQDTGLDVDEEAFAGGDFNKPVSPPYDMSASSIKAHYIQKGAISVTVQLLTTSEVDSLTPSLRSVVPPLRSPKFERNVRMLTLRSLAYESSLHLPHPFPEASAARLYVREDNYFLDDNFQVQSLKALCPKSGYCYVVDKHCPQVGTGYIHKGWADKIYLLSGTAAERMFSGATATENVKKYWPPGSNSEQYLSNLMQSSGYVPSTADFRRTEVRFVAGVEEPCVAAYGGCNSGMEGAGVKMCPKGPRGEG